MFKWRRSRGKNGSISTLEAIENIGRREPVPQKESPTGNIVLHVQLPNGQPCSVSPFTPSNTIRDVKALIEEQTGIKPARYRLFYEGQLLPDDAALRDYGIWASTPLYLVALLEIALRKPNGQLIPIAVWQTNTVLDLKCRVEERLFIPPEQQVLIKQSGGELAILVVPPSDSVDEIKRTITNSMLCFPTKEPPTQSGEDIIDDHRIVSDCGMNWKTTLDLFPLIRTALQKPSGDAIPLLVSPANTVWDLKILLEDSLRVDRKDQILTFNGSVLRNARTVEDSGIVNDSVILLMSARRLQIIVRHEKGAEIARLDASSTDTVLDFKKSIHATTGIPVVQQTLKRQDQVMEDNRCISYYRIAWGSVVTILPFDFTVSVLLDAETRRSLALSVSSTDTVKDIRSIIDQRHSAYLSLCGETSISTASSASAGILTPGRYDLELDGRMLEDSTPLYNFGFSEANVMRVLPLPGVAEEPVEPQVVEGAHIEEIVSEGLVEGVPVDATTEPKDDAVVDSSIVPPTLSRRPSVKSQSSSYRDGADRPPKPPERRISEIMRDIQASSPVSFSIEASSLSATIISPPPAWEPPKPAPEVINETISRPRAGSSKGPLPQIPSQRPPAVESSPLPPDSPFVFPPPVSAITPLVTSPEPLPEEQSEVTESSAAPEPLPELRQPFEAKSGPPSSSRPTRASMVAPKRHPSDAKHKRNMSDVKQDAYPHPGLRRLLAPDTPSPPPPYLDMDMDLSGQITDVSPHPIAHGGLCDVYTGEGPGGLKVGMKVLRIRVGHTPANVRRRVAREVKIWRKLRHPNILPFHGTFEDGPRIYMVSPWLKNGTVNDYLRANPDADRHKILRETVSGLVYLASRDPPVIHGDIKGQNILIADNGSAVLGDYGLTILTEALMESSTISELRGASSVRWMAPELLMPDRLAALGFREKGRNLKTDVYSIGPLIVELFTGEQPFSDLKNNIHVMLAVVQGERPRRPSRRSDAALRGLDDDLWAVAESCWNDDPNMRPTIVDVAFALAQAS